MLRVLKCSLAIGMAICWATSGNAVRADYITALDTIAGGDKISHWNLQTTSAGVDTALDSWTTDPVDGANHGDFSATGISHGVAGPRPDIANGSFLGFSPTNNAVAFTGTSAQLLSMAPDGFEGEDELTLLMFVKIDSLLTTNDRFLGGIHATTLMNRYHFSLISRTSSGGAMRGGVRVWDGAAESGGLFDAPGAFRDDAWHFVALTMENDGTDKLVKIYVDGDQIATPSDSISGASGDGLAPRVTTAATKALSFGNDMGDTTRWLRGSMDEIAFIGKALSADDVEDLYQAALVPEPGSMTLFGIGGLIGLAVIRKRRAMKK